MRIAVVISKFPAFNETFIHDQITGLIDRGHDVHIYALLPSDGSTVDPELERYNLLGKTIYRDEPKFVLPENRLRRLAHGIPLFAKGMLAGPFGTLNALNIFRLGRRASSLESLYEVSPFTTGGAHYDIVHCHFPENGELAVRMRDLGALSGKVITQFHSYHLPYFRTGRAPNVFPNLFKKGDLFLTSGNHSKRFFDLVGWGGTKMIIHHYSVNVAHYQFSRPPAERGAPIRLLSVGRLVDKKGFQFAIQAVAKIIPLFPDVLYEIAGEGTLRPMLEQLIGNLGVGKNVKLLGAQTRDEVLHRLQRASIFLAPCVTSDGKTDGWLGDVETGPVVILEAMASGLPVISTFHTGIPEFLHDGESGYLLEERDADAIADRLVLLMNQPETRREMGEKGRNWVHEYHNTEKQNDRLVEVYRLLLQGGSPARYPNPQRLMEPLMQEAPLDDNQVSQLAARLGRWNSGVGSPH